MDIKARKVNFYTPKQKYHHIIKVLVQMKNFSIIILYSYTDPDNE